MFNAWMHRACHISRQRYIAHRCVLICDFCIILSDAARSSFCLEMKLALLVIVIPCLQTCHWQQHIGCGTPFGRSSFFEEIVDQLLAVRIGDGVWGIAPQSEAQAAFVSVIDMTMKDEGIDGGQGLNLFPCEEDARHIS